MKAMTDRKNTKYHVTTLIPILIVLLILINLPIQGQPSVKKPNIIYILADDLGYGDLGCYGQKHFATPHIDNLAKHGMRFTHHYAGAPVCAPSRSALLTGLHTGHTPVRGNKEVLPEGQWPLPTSSHLLTELLKSTGYITGAFGKWGLGFPGSEGAPNKQGVDSFYGYNCQRLAHNYFPEYLWDNEEQIFLAGNKGTSKGDYAPDKIHQHALQFLQDQKDTTFFLFYPMVIPHAELVAPEPYMARHRGKYLPERIFNGTDEGERFRKGAYGSQAESHAAFAAMINLMDDQVGEILSKLEELHLDKNTIIIFTSDNGPHQEGGADPDFFDSNGILKGYKRDLYEGGIRVPMIVRWPGVIKGGVITDHVSAFWDVMPTVADIIDAKVPEEVDGISFLPTLTGQNAKQKKHDHLYWEFHELGGRMALRKGDWKLIQYNVNKIPAGQFELYNLKDDPSEENNLAMKYPDKVKALKGIMLTARIPSEIFRFASESYHGEK
jgi:arylsulfatase A-like enzyme